MHKLLVVDDQNGMRSLLEEVFHQEGLSVLTAATGTDALKQLRSIRPDLMLLDLKLPGLDGYAVLQEAHHLYPMLPVIVMTAAYDEKCMSDLRSRTGVLAVLTKPFDLWKVKNLVMDYLCATLPKEA